MSNLDFYEIREEIKRLRDELEDLQEELKKLETFIKDRKNKIYWGRR